VLAYRRELNRCCLFSPLFLPSAPLRILPVWSRRQLSVSCASARGIAHDFNEQYNHLNPCRNRKKIFHLIHPFLGRISFRFVSKLLVERSISITCQFSASVSPVDETSKDKTHPLLGRHPLTEMPFDRAWTRSRSSFERLSTASRAIASIRQ
jgi:hypothetical protein